MLSHLISILLFTNVFSAYCHGKPGAYYQNHEQIWKGDPTFIKSHQYGKLYEVGEGTTKTKLVHVYGNMYQMGFAQGFLLSSEISKFMKQLWVYMVKQSQQSLPKQIPKFLQQGTANFALETALDLTYHITKHYTNNKYYEELKGLSDATGVSFKSLRRVHMIGQLTKGACSMFGAWGSATQFGQTVQLRALDWDFNGPYRNYPVVVIYHPVSPKYGNAWLNIGFMGWVGVLSGVNEHQLAVSEIGVSYPDQTFGKESRFGNPFTFVLRDVLQWDSTIQQSEFRLKKTRRTCNLILGVGDGKKDKYFRGFQYSHSVLNVVNDSQPLPANSSWHAALPQTVYWGMDWNCPPYHARLHEMLDKYHGNITAQNTIRYILPGLNSGNLQAVVYDLSYQWVYFAFGYRTSTTTTNAYARPYIGLNLKEMFAWKSNQFFINQNQIQIQK